MKPDGSEDEPLARYLYEHARDIILVIDPDSGWIVEVNRAAELAYRYTRDELLALTIYNLRVDAAPVLGQMRMANTDGLLFEAVHRRSDGTTFPVEVSSRGDTVERHRLLFSIIRDISERRQLEAERAELLTTTQHALALRDEFLQVASHELRTPVANVKLQLQQLRRLLDRDAPVERLRDGTDAALRELARLATLIDTLLDAQQVTNAQPAMVLELADVDLAELVRDVAERLHVQADQARSPVTVDVPSIHLRCDRLRIEQVLVNLVTNALKYGGGHPIEIRAMQDADAVRIEVCDHGIGVANEDAARIFDKFERAVPSGNYGGFGLGLYIARQLIEAHGGHIEIASEPAAGATFTIVIPSVRA
ncbi:MAG: HAMP domain-containing histidine kinase [Deltaproteobacteria bacterium]|nr:HAMP domain-containing histidine kinase [Deltaproteobacteria bacterium]